MLTLLIILLLSSPITPTHPISWNNAIYDPISNLTVLYVPVPECDSVSWDCRIVSSCVPLHTHTYCSSQPHHHTVKVRGVIEGPVNGWFTYRNGSIREFHVRFHVSYGEHCDGAWVSFTRVGRACSSGHVVSPMVMNGIVEFKVHAMATDSDRTHKLVVNVNGKASISVHVPNRQQICSSNSQMEDETDSSSVVHFAADYSSYFISGEVEGAGRCQRTTHLFFESVPSVPVLDNPSKNTTTEQLRVFSSHWKSLSHSPTVTPTNETSAHRHMCLYFNAANDGMKHKVLHTIRSLDATTYSWTFFACTLPHMDVDKDTIIPSLRSLPNVRIRPCLPAIELSLEDMSASSSLNASDSLLEYSSQKGVPVDMGLAFEYAVLRLHASRNHTSSTSSSVSMLLDGVTPQWVQSLWVQALDHFATLPKPCNAILFGNERSAMSGLFTEVARMLRVPSLMELPNLFPHPIVRPDIVIADSVFALNHSSVSPLFTVSPDLPGVAPSEGVVISSGIDTVSRQQQSITNGKYLCPSYCRPSPPPDYLLFSEYARIFPRCGDCFIVGIVCRLSEEKAVGLFLLAAAEAVHTYGCKHCHFIIIGDGPLRVRLEDMSNRLGVSDQVTFLGWVENDSLPGQLASWDVAVTTGAWRETFSIVGLEHMALGVPLVTYAAGGMGEYVAEPENSIQIRVEEYLDALFSDTDGLHELWATSGCMYSYNIERLYKSDKTVKFPYPFMESDNAIVTIDPCPHALAAAMLYLDKNDDVRSKIGYQGIVTATNHFSSEKNILAYDKLFYDITST